MMRSKVISIILIAAMLVSPLSAIADNSGEFSISIQQNRIEISGTQGQLTAYPLAICQLQNVETISLTDHIFTEIPECISQNGRTLRQLRLARNGISKISANMFQLKFLEELDLSSNKIVTKQSDDWSGLSKIRSLTLNNNPISELPSSIGNLTSLEVLSLANTLIAGLPDSFSNLTSLRVLDLGNTKITVTPKSFSSFVNLQKLNLAGVSTLTAAEKNVIRSIFKDRAVEITWP